MTTLNHASVTLDHSAFAIADKDGFKMYQLNPLHFRMYKDYVIKVGPVRLVKQDGNSRRIIYVSALAGGRFAQNNLMIFDVARNEEYFEITTPSRYGPITNIHVSPNRLVALNPNRMFVWTYPDDIKQIRSEDIRPNPKGISAMSYDPTTAACYLAYPGFKTGSVQIMHLNALTARESKSPIVIEAHLTDIAQVALNCQGTLVATGSTKGTVIRVFDARTKGPLYELRRGTVQAHLQCMAFSPCSSYLAVASDKGTLHMFGIRDAEPQKKKNVLERSRGSSSIVKIQLDRPVMAIGFGKIPETPKNLQSIIAICADATYWRHEFYKDNTGNFTSHFGSYDELIEVANDSSFFRTPVE